MDHPPTDAQLLTRFAHGDSDSLAILADRYEHSLLGVARGLLHARDDLARDAVQDCWLRVIRHAARFRGDSSVHTWIYRILVNRCLDHRAAESRAASNGLPDDLPQFADPDPAAAIASADFDSRISRAVAALPDPMRVVLILCYHRGLTLQQSADILALPLGTLKTRLHAALVTLRESLALETIS